ncbi:hypothetical protein TNIN_167751 [Trichonephila inaurata madagascariensis]|uniref:Uncharacterized protein n=1 Tax=Trichonephila inaurata madagascariensis TaxID=2747483 RepID=A0A8X6JCW1_9ARAC|nr:hypothetical protein TNIN_167751 [Trichonephila inaurata madagascariensis]
MGKDAKINQAKSLSTVNEQQKPRSALSMLSNYILSLDVKEWWSLETIGIRDPFENLKGKELNSESIKRPVLTPTKTTKIRSVLDATARESGKPSLNDVLHKGSSLIELIPDILDRFPSASQPTLRKPSCS